MHGGRQRKTRELVEESQQQVACCRKLVQQSVARAEASREIIVQCANLVRGYSVAVPL